MKLIRPLLFYRFDDNSIQGEEKSCASRLRRLSLHFFHSFVDAVYSKLTTYWSILLPRSIKQITLRQAQASRPTSTRTGLSEPLKQAAAVLSSIASEQPSKENLVAVMLFDEDDQTREYAAKCIASLILHSEHELVGVNLNSVSPLPGTKVHCSFIARVHQTAQLIHSVHESTMLFLKKETNPIVLEAGFMIAESCLRNVNYSVKMPRNRTSPPLVRSAQSIETPYSHRIVFEFGGQARRVLFSQPYNEQLHSRLFKILSATLLVKLYESPKEQEDESEAMFLYRSRRNGRIFSMLTDPFWEPPTSPLSNKLTNLKTLSGRPPPQQKETDRQIPEHSPIISTLSLIGSFVRSFPPSADLDALLALCDNPQSVSLITAVVLFLYHFAVIEQYQLVMKTITKHTFTTSTSFEHSHPFFIDDCLNFLSTVMSFYPSALFSQPFLLPLLSDSIEAILNPSSIPTLLHRPEVTGVFSLATIHIRNIALSLCLSPLSSLSLSMTILTDPFDDVALVPAVIVPSSILTSFGLHADQSTLSPSQQNTFVNMIINRGLWKEYVIRWLPICLSGTDWLLTERAIDGLRWVHAGIVNDSWPDIDVDLQKRTSLKGTIHSLILSFLAESDTANNVLLFGVKLAGSYILNPHLSCLDPLFFHSLLVAFRTLATSSSFPLKNKGHWALATLFGELKPVKFCGEIDDQTLRDGLLLFLEGMNDVEKIRVHSVRGVGNILRLALDYKWMMQLPRFEQVESEVQGEFIGLKITDQERTFSSEPGTMTVEEVQEKQRKEFLRIFGANEIERVLRGILNCLKKGSSKLKWNCCSTVAPLLSSTHYVLFGKEPSNVNDTPRKTKQEPESPEQALLTAVLFELCRLCTSSPNLKVKTSILSALTTNTPRSMLGPRNVYVAVVSCILAITANLDSMVPSQLPSDQHLKKKQVNAANSILLDCAFYSGSTTGRQSNRTAQRQAHQLHIQKQTEEQFNLLREQCALSCLYIAREWPPKEPSENSMLRSVVHSSAKAVLDLCFSYCESLPSPRVEVRESSRQVQDKPKPGRLSVEEEKEGLEGLLTIVDSISTLLPPNLSKKAMKAYKVRLEQLSQRRLDDASGNTPFLERDISTQQPQPVGETQESKEVSLKRPKPQHNIRTVIKIDTHKRGTEKDLDGNPRDTNGKDDIPEDTLEITQHSIILTPPPGMEYESDSDEEPAFNANLEEPY
ncbi:hypothetical protein BLNAU_593 [Blattamonas nauphoetae]|uniref:Uncharacterized protein n=1 Tax=Blattamonas nauphoetae TaxID=2049346 RepID=A0ABQ9YLQ0_9EUKA|nr:hypothetical protein BLNAU_593 [Blattamonas nauphoetae]